MSNGLSNRVTALLVDLVRGCSGRVVWADATALRGSRVLGWRSFLLPDPNIILFHQLQLVVPGTMKNFILYPFLLLLPWRLSACAVPSPKSPSNIDLFLKWSQRFGIKKQIREAVFSYFTENLPETEVPFEGPVHPSHPSPRLWARGRSCMVDWLPPTSRKPQEHHAASLSRCGRFGLVLCAVNTGDCIYSSVPSLGSDMIKTWQKNPWAFTWHIIFSTLWRPSLFPQLTRDHL